MICHVVNEFTFFGPKKMYLGIQNTMGHYPSVTGYVVYDMYTSLYCSTSCAICISKTSRKLRCLPKRQLITYIILACNQSVIVDVRLCWIASAYNSVCHIVRTYIFSLISWPHWQVFVIPHNFCIDIVSSCKPLVIPVHILSVVANHPLGRQFSTSS